MTESPATLSIPWAPRRCRGPFEGFQTLTAFARSGVPKAQRARMRLNLLLSHLDSDSQHALDELVMECIEITAAAQLRDPALLESVSAKVRQASARRASTVRHAGRPELKEATRSKWATAKAEGMSKSAFCETEARILTLAGKKVVSETIRVHWLKGL